MDTSTHHSDAFILEELENNRQELHAARRHIEVLTANVGHLETENTELNNVLSEMSQQRKNSLSSDLGKTDAKYRQQMAEYQQMLEEAQTSDRLAKETIKKLEEQLRVAVETASSAVPLCVDNDEDIAALQLKISDLEEEKNNLKLKLYESVLELKQKTDEVARLQQELTEKEEEIECMESQFTTQCSINERLREENSEMRAQLETETGHVDVGKKGNSLFAEVDDRRIVAEKKIVKVESVMRELEEKLTKEQKENKRLKLQILLLRQTSSKGYDDNVVKNLQGQLVENKRTIISLTEQLQKREPLLSKQNPQPEAKFSVSESATDSDKLFINFLQGIITHKTKEAEEAKAEAQQSHLQCLRTELRVTEFKNEIMTLTNDCDRLKGMNSHLTMAIQEMQQKYEPELFAPPSKEKIKIPLNESERLPLSQNDKQQPNVITPTTCVKERTLNHKTSSANEEHVVMAGDKATEKFDKYSKENIPLRQSDVAGTWQGKSVRMMSQVDVISSQGERGLEELKTDGEGQKVKKLRGGGGGTGKYRSVNHMNVDSQPTECNQQ